MNCVVLLDLIAVFGIVWLPGGLRVECEVGRGWIATETFWLDGWDGVVYGDGEQSLFENIIDKSKCCGE